MTLARNPKQLSLLNEVALSKQVPGLLPFLPMLYVAWSDGILNATELGKIGEVLQEVAWLTEDERLIVLGWLDPDSPPSPEQLIQWLKTIRTHGAQLPATSRQSLVDLGVQIARIGAESESERCTTAAACAALAEIEATLGVASEEAVRDLLPKHYPGALPASDADEEAEKPSSFDVAAMTRLLDGEDTEIRNKVRKLLSAPSFAYKYELSKEAYREQVLVWLKALAKHGLGALSYPRASGGADNLAQFMAAFETIAFHDLSLTIKFGVQYGLFGGSILNLGTGQHHEKYLRDIGTLALPGCFAMTELGHGSNVRDIETTARFDKDSDAFVIHTPRESARKDYIGNAARHGRMATVFAQLEIDGEGYGVHAFLVPIRDENGSALPGVRLEDCGEKLGLNGVDNGRIWFDHVRVPRANLLNRFAEVSPDGRYSSAISSASQRFFTMLGTLVGGRISISAAAMSAAKAALTIAIRYAGRRRQFGSPGEPERLLIDYPSHQRRLLPLLANVYAIDFAQKHLGEAFLNRSEENARQVEVLAAGLKAFSSWNTTETVQTCREACGGQGYLASNRLAALKADTDVFTTFEGDNVVLLQLVAKSLLTDFRHQFNDMKFLDLVKYAAKQASTVITELNPVITRISDEDHLRDPEFQIGAFTYREQDLLISAARRIKKRIDDGKDSYSAFVECQDHLINLALAHVERVVLEQFQIGVQSCSDAPLAGVLKRLCDLFALSRIEHDKGWFLENGYIEGGKSKAIRSQIDKLCAELRGDAVDLVNAFGIPESCLAAPIAAA